MYDGRFTLPGIFGSRRMHINTCSALRTGHLPTARIVRNVSLPRWDILGPIFCKRRSRSRASAFQVCRSCYTWPSSLSSLMNAHYMLLQIWRQHQSYLAIQYAKMLGFLLVSPRSPHWRKSIFASMCLHSHDWKIRPRPTSSNLP